MPHRADKTFFENKRPWSKRKDHILAYYLEPYLAKVARLRRPIFLVDGFAGPGKFDDGQVGSPLILCSKALAALERGVKISVLCIEPDPELFERLQENLSPFPFAEPVCGTFLDHVQRVASSARTHTTFLYVDPWTVEGLEWSALEVVFRHLEESAASVELLMNFNARSFVRRGLAALQREIPTVNPAIEDSEDPEEWLRDSPTADHLSKIVGGPWWQEALSANASFAEQVRAVTERICIQLRRWFDEVGYLAIKANPAHVIPLYYLVFASRHADGLVLMNDAMVKTRGTSIFYLNLFAESDLNRMIVELASAWVPRGHLIQEVIRRAFCMFSWSEIRGAIEDLLKAGKLKSSTGRTRINDTVEVRRT